MITAVAFMLGITIGLLIKVTRMENRDKRQRAIIKKLHGRLSGADKAFKRERDKRYDAEIDLEDLREVAEYQRDKLYELSHPAKLVCYTEEV